MQILPDFKVNVCNLFTKEAEAEGWILRGLGHIVKSRLKKANSRMPCIWYMIIALCTNLAV